MESYNGLERSLNNHSCRICLEEDYSENMIYPCKCKGTAKYVHKHCLNEWRTTSTNRDNFYRCEMCHYRYKIINPELNESMFSDCLRNISNSIMGFYFLYSIFIFALGKLFYHLDDEKIIFKTLTFNTTHDSDFIQPFYYLFSGFDIFLLQIILIIYWFCTAKNKRLYCKLYLNSKTLIINTIFIMVVSGFLFGWLISILFLQLLSLRLFQIHFTSIDALHKLNSSHIENYDESLESEIETQDAVLQLNDENKIDENMNIELVNGIETANI